MLGHVVVIIFIIAIFYEAFKSESASSARSESQSHDPKREEP